MGKTDVSRRAFLAGGALLGGAMVASGITGCAATGGTDEGSDLAATGAGESWDKTADILVLGGGVGGTITAYDAALKGANVILVEAGSELGGTCLISGGNLHAGTLGGATPSNTVEELVAMSPTINTNLVPRYVQKWTEFRDWIFETGAPNLNVVYDVMVSVGMNYKNRKEFFDFFVDEIEGAGSEILLDTRAVRLCADDAGAVQGAVVVAQDGSSMRIGASSVILATGGFTANDEMRKRYFGAYGDNMVGRVVPFNQGDGHRMAMELGAQLTKGMGQFYGHIVPYPSIIPEDAAAYNEVSKDDLFTGLGTMQLILPTGILVNLNGKRFADETSGLHIMPGNPFDCNAAALFGNEPQGYGYAIFDSSSEATVEGVSALEGVGAVVDKADTLEDLVAALEARNVYRAALKRTLDEFNSADPADFDVRSTSRELGMSAPLTKGPFYAVQVTGGASGMFGGLKIDEDARVLGYADVPIQNLYATACCAGGFSYDEYIGSLALSAAMGLVAVETIMGAAE